MSFAAALEILRPTLPYYLALTKYRLLNINEHAFEFCPNPKAPELANEMARTVFALGASSCTESYVMSRTLAEGPKIFSFSDALTCEALENFDLNVGTGDYLQPFPSVVIELPADYTKKRVVPFEEGTHAPDFIIVRHEPEARCVLVTMHLTSHQVLTRLLKLDPAWTLEEMWHKGERIWDAKDTLGMTAEEKALGSSLSKLALNVCLMATAYGIRCLGPANPSHFERLKRHAKAASKPCRVRSRSAARATASARCSTWPSGAASAAACSSRAISKACSTSRTSRSVRTSTVRGINGLLPEERMEPPLVYSWPHQLPESKATPQRATPASRQAGTLETVTPPTRKSDACSAELVLRAQSSWLRRRSASLVTGEISC